MIRKVTKSDSAAICSIYNYYVKNTIVTFEEMEVSAEEMEKRIEEITKEYPWLVYEKSEKVIAYAYASRWKDRAAYRYSAESTIYIAPTYIGKGIGTQLYAHLIKKIEETKIHSLIGGISLPNEGSIALHEKLGFKKCGEFKEVGNKFNTWIHVGYWEKVFNDNGPYG